MTAYPGGKSGSGVYQQLINLMPPHNIYVEPFLGGGAVMRLKRPAQKANVGIDADPDALVSFRNRMWRADNLPVYLVCGDARKWLRQSSYVQEKTTLVYLDPPYLMETRSCKRPLYRCELASREEHTELLEIALGLPCMVMISGYYSELYAQMLAGWRTAQFTAQTRGGKPATEWVWMNFEEPLELHDYRYLGGNFRERERIKRKQARWKNRLELMDAHERYALLSVLQDLRCGTGENGDSTR